ncbi:unnamed protein product [Larinioides sclopetarius]|uniref:Uncharacterized protein n=1 Tax=Larinioides sclopetarius TaxID=280406 RepID=A0AAV2BP80_9ARAC
MAEHFETVSVILPTTEGEISPVLLAEKTVESDATPNPPVASVPPLVLSFDKGEVIIILFVYLYASEKLLATRTLEYIMGTIEEAPRSSHDGGIPAMFMSSFLILASLEPYWLLLEEHIDSKSIHLTLQPL